MNGRDIYINEIEYDFEIMKDVWVNYPEKRKTREELSKKHWLSLYNATGGSGKISFLLDAEISKLSKFHEFSKGNRELSSKLVSEFFLKVKEKYRGEESLDSQEYFDFLEHLKSIELEKISKLEIPGNENKQRVFRKISELESRLSGLDEKSENFEKLSQELAYKKELYTKFEIKSKIQSRLKEIEWYANIDIYSVEEGIYALDKLDIESINIEKLHGYLKNFLQARNSWSGIFEELEKEFEEYYRKLKDVHDIFESLALLSGAGWDMNKSIFSDSKWLEIEKISKLLQEKEKLKKLIDSIGRLKENESFDFEGILQEVAKSRKKIVSKLSKNETLGTHQSNDLARVLPIELVNLSDDTLGNVFYAKYIENRLNTYLLGGWHFESQEQNKNGAKKKNKKQKGPIIMCVDTSSSMMGEAEKVAKSAVFAMMKRAAMENRKVYLLSFSSVNEVKEYELTDPENGLENLLDFLLFSFGGGTDYLTPLKKSIEILKKDRYRKADILLVSDGMCKIGDEFSKKLKAEKQKLDFKIHSLIIGSESVEDDFSDRVVHYRDI